MMGHGPMMHGLAGAGLDRSGPFGICRSRCLSRMDSGFRSRRRYRQRPGVLRAVPALDGGHGDHHSGRLDVGRAPRYSSLGSLAVAAERLGRDVTAPPLPETGTIETRQASRAFNDMQIRLRNLIENRTRLLAAISHDLRTPLTLLRLRAENVEDQEERDKMLATIAEMDSMIDATLKFARDETSGRAPASLPTSQLFCKASSTI